MTGRLNGLDYKNIVNLDNSQHALNPDHDIAAVKKKDVKLLQKLREEAGVVEAPQLIVAARSQEWLEGLSLHFPEFLWRPSR